MLQQIPILWKTEQRYINSRLFYLFILSGVGMGVLHAYLDTFVFFAGTGTFFDFLFLNVPAPEALSRTLVLTLFVVLGYFVSKKSYRLEHEKALLEHSLNKSPEAIYWLDKKGKFYYVNCSAAEILGYSTDEFKSLTTVDLHKNDPAYTAETWPNRWKLLQEKKVLQYETQLSRKDSSVIDVEIVAKLVIHHKREFFVAYARDIGKRKAKEKKIIRLNRELEELASRDKLTGILNRSKFEDFLQQSLAEYKRYSKGIGVIMFDIDHFKSVNDTYGHIIGDSVLKQLAALVQDLIRESDIFARWGGEEFVILLPHSTLDEAHIVANKIHTGIEKHQFKSIGDLTVSIGVAAANRNDNSESLFLRVDRALYRAKESGRNRVCLAEDSV